MVDTRARPRLIEDSGGGAGSGQTKPDTKGRTQRKTVSFFRTRELRWKRNIRENPIRRAQDLILPSKEEDPATALNTDTSE